MTWTYFLYSYIFVPALMLAYIIFGAWLTYRIGSKPKSWPGKTGAAGLTALLFIAVPSADVVLGRFKFSNLCESGAAVRVFRTVALDAKYVKSDGSLKTEQTIGKPEYKIGEQYIMRFSQEQVFAWPRITRFRAQILDTERGDVLGEMVDYQYWGGWLVHQMPGHLSATSCPGQGKSQKTFEQMVFRVSATR